MNKDILFTIIYCAVTVAAFCVGKYVFPKIPADVKDKLGTLTDWAASFVVWAREFFKNSTGAEKMAEVVKQLKRIAEEAGIEVTEDQLKAIAQKAYEAMKAGEAEAQPVQLAEVAQTPSATVIINTTAPATVEDGKTAVATDNVPPDALKQNPDGTFNAYDAAGNKAGTISAAEYEAAGTDIDGVAVE